MDYGERLHLPTARVYDTVLVKVILGMPRLLICWSLAGILLAPVVAPAAEREPYSCEPDLIEIMFAADSRVRIRNGKPVDLNKKAGAGASRGVTAVLEAAPGAAWRRCCNQVSEEKLDEIHRRGEARTGKPLYNLNNIYRLRIEKGVDVWAKSAELEALPGVELARPVPKPVPPPLPPSYGNQQGYLHASANTPAGLGAREVWSLPGGTGAGVAVCDIEYGWNFNHADLTKAPGSLLNTITSIYEDHGTASIGVLVADPNGWGTTGICYGAELKTCGSWNGASWNVPGAITIAVAALSPGDVILLEQQWDYGDDDFVPVEWWQSYSPDPQRANGVYVAIQNAVANGIHVVQAAGNGGQDLDSMVWVGDSGAILVGAGGTTAGDDRQRLSYSCYGSRVDMQGWGRGVYTTGYGDAYSAEGENYEYTATFSGTSSSSATIAGALACLNGYWKASFGVPCPPALARRILVDTGRAQVNPSSGHIGPRPDLRAVCVADLDTDGDGMPDSSEVIADTDPLGSNSFLRIVGIAGGGGVRGVSFSGSVDRVYSLLGAQDPGQAEWSAVVEGVRGSNAVMTLTDPSPSPRGFYRVGVRVP